MEIFKSDSLIRIKVKDKSQSHIIYHHEEVKSFLFGKIEKGFYGAFPHEKLTISEIGEIGNYIIEDKIVYNKPYVELIFIDRKKKKVKFTTYEECFKYAQKIKTQNFESSFELN